MTRPTFKWHGDAESPKGVATFFVGEHTLEHPFPSFSEAHETFEFIEAAYERGVFHGHHQVMGAVVEAMERVTQ